MVTKLTGSSLADVVEIHYTQAGGPAHIKQFNDDGDGPEMVRDWEYPTLRAAIDRHVQGWDESLTADNFVNEVSRAQDRASVFNVPIGDARQIARDLQDA